MATHRIRQQASQQVEHGQLAHVKLENPFTTIAHKDGLSGVVGGVDGVEVVPTLIVPHTYICKSVFGPVIVGGSSIISPCREVGLGRVGIKILDRIVAFPPHTDDRSIIAGIDQTNRISPCYVLGIGPGGRWQSGSDEVRGEGLDGHTSVIIGHILGFVTGKSGNLVAIKNIVVEPEIVQPPYHVFIGTRITLAKETKRPSNVLGVINVAIGGKLASINVNSKSADGGSVGFGHGKGEVVPRGIHISVGRSQVRLGGSVIHDSETIGDGIDNIVDGLTIPQIKETRPIVFGAKEPTRNRKSICAKGETWDNDIAVAIEIKGGVAVPEVKGVE